MPGVCIQWRKMLLKPFLFLWNSQVSKALLPTCMWITRTDQETSSKSHNHLQIAVCQHHRWLLIHCLATTSNSNGPSVSIMPRLQQLTPTGKPIRSASGSEMQPCLTTSWWPIYSSLLVRLVKIFYPWPWPVNTFHLNYPHFPLSITQIGGTQTIPAHKYVLATGSSVFHAMFFGGLAESEAQIEVPDVEPAAFLTLLK